MTASAHSRSPDYVAQESRSEHRNSAYSIQGEMLWLLHRAGEVVRNHDGSSREMILQFAAVSFPSRAHRQMHSYEKPVELCEFLIRKHSRPGGIIGEAFSLHAGMS